MHSARELTRLDTHDPFETLAFVTDVLVDYVGEQVWNWIAL